MSKQDVQDLQQKYRPTTLKIQQHISLYTWGTFYPCVHQTHRECLLLKSSFFLFHLTIEASPIWSSSRVWLLNMLEIIFGWARRIFLESVPNNMWWCRCYLTPKRNLSLQFSSCGPCRVFSHSNSPPHRALGRYRHTSFSRQIHNIFCWLEILNYCPDGGNGNFHCSSSFLKATSLICEAQLSFAAHQKYILWFFSLWWMIKGIWALFSLLFIFLWNRKTWLDNFMFIIPLECSKL